MTDLNLGQRSMTRLPQADFHYPSGDAENNSCLRKQQEWNSKASRATSVPGFFLRLMAAASVGVRVQTEESGD